MVQRALTLVRDGTRPDVALVQLVDVLKEDDQEVMPRTDAAPHAQDSVNGLQDAGSQDAGRIETFIEEHLDELDSPVLEVLAQVADSAHKSNNVGLAHTIEQNIPVAHTLRELLLELQQFTDDDNLAKIARRIAICEGFLSGLPNNTTNELWSKAQWRLGYDLLRLFELTGIVDAARRAVEVYSAMSEVYDREQSPEDWATIQNNLAVLHMTLFARLGQEEDARKAEESLRLALEVYTLETAPDKWADAYSNLGGLYLSLYRQTGEERNARKAEESLRLALKVHTFETAPDNWATTHNSLGGLYLALYWETGEERNARKAEESYRLALQVRTYERAPFRWADSHNNLGNLYLSLYRQTEQEGDARKAEESFRLALKVITLETAPIPWAAIHNNLASLYMPLYARSGQEEDARKAEESYRLALQVHTREQAPRDWAAIHNNLGGFYQAVYDRSRQEEDARKAEESLRLALQVRTREQAPRDWATTHNNLAYLYASSYSQTGQEEDARKAEDSFRFASMIFDPSVMPNHAVATNRVLARFRVEYGRKTNGSLAPAHNAYVRAITAARVQYLSAPSDGERRRLMANHATLFKEDALCLLHMGEHLQALARLDEGRARLLGETLGLRAIARRKGPQVLAVLEVLQRQRAESEATLRRVEERRAKAQTPEEEQEARNELNTMWEQVNQATQALEAYVVAEELEPPTLDTKGLRALMFPAHMAAVALLPGENTHALVLHGGEVHAISLPSLNGDALTDLMRRRPAEVERWIDAYDDRHRALRLVLQELKEGGDINGADFLRAEATFESAQSAWKEILLEIGKNIDTLELGWYFAYQFAFEVVRREGDLATQQGANNAWHNTVERTRIFLAKHFWEPLDETLKNLGITEVLLVPAGAATLLPLHAAAPDWLTVAYAPSLGVWQRSRSVWAHTLKNMLLATPSARVSLKDKGLPWTLREAEWLIAHAEGLNVNVTHLDTQDAIVERVSSAMHNHSIVHFAGHAGYNWNNPLATGLECYDGLLRLENMTMLNLEAVRLVTLSACSTGMSDVLGSGEEMVGLPGGLLAAGAPAVVASLWPVHDVSTAFLMDEFYSRWLRPQGEAVSIALALKRAAEWLQTASKAMLLERLAARTTNELARAKVLGAYRTALRQAPNAYGGIDPLDPDSLGETSQGESQEGWDEDVFSEMIARGERLGVTQVLEAAMDVRNRPADPPFAEAYYWAPFAAYGIVLDEDKV